MLVYFECSTSSFCDVSVLYCYLLVPSSSVYFTSLYPSSPLTIFITLDSSDEFEKSSTEHTALSICRGVPNCFVTHFSPMWSEMNLAFKSNFLMYFASHLCFDSRSSQWSPDTIKQSSIMGNLKGRSLKSDGLVGVILYS